MRKACFFGGWAVFALVAVLWANPGVVHLNDGSQINGDITAGADNVTVAEHGIVTTIPRDQIKSIEYGTIDDQYEAKMAKLGPRDVAGRVAVAQWAADQRRFDLARRAAAQALEIDPNNPAALEEMHTITYQAALTTQPVAERAAPVAAAPTTVPAGGAYLTAAQINVIRQLEMKPDDGVRVNFLHDVRRRFLATMQIDPPTFYNMSDADQARKILGMGNPDLAKDVIIASDPASMLEYRTRIQPLILGGCAISGCHDTLTHAADLGLIKGDDSPRAWYTNFYRLETYVPKKSKIEGALPRYMIDRLYPDRSLLIQCALPRTEADAPHPAVPGLFQTLTGRNDPHYDSLLHWIGTMLKPDVENYGLVEAAATTQPVR